MEDPKDLPVQNSSFQDEDDEDDDYVQDDKKPAGSRSAAGCEQCGLGCLPRQADQADRAVWCWWLHRHGGPPAGRQDGPHPGPGRGD